MRTCLNRRYVFGELVEQIVPAALMIIACGDRLNPGLVQCQPGLPAQVLQTLPSAGSEGAPAGRRHLSNNTSGQFAPGTGSVGVLVEKATGVIIQVYDRLKSYLNTPL